MNRGGGVFENVFRIKCASFWVDLRKKAVDLRCKAGILGWKLGFGAEKFASNAQVFEKMGIKRGENWKKTEKFGKMKTN